jgi:hypothetical protein
VGYEPTISVLERAKTVRALDQAATAIGEGHSNFRGKCCHLYSNCSNTMQRYVIVLAYLGRRCTKFHIVGWKQSFLRPFIWSRVSGLMRFRIGSDKGTASNFVHITGKSATETRARSRKVFGEESVGCTRKVQTYRDRKSRDIPRLLCFPNWR